jgi:hypothetical protein
MTKYTTICAGIDTGKRKLDVAIEGRCARRHCGGGRAIGKGQNNSAV